MKKFRIGPDRFHIDDIKKIDLELFKDAYAIIDGIPDDRIDLELFQQGPLNRLATDAGGIHCGTICCAGGWLALHPTMQAHGLFTLSMGGFPRFVLDGKCYIGFDALEEVFKMPPHMVEHLFSSRGDEDDDEYDLYPDSDKQLWLHRARTVIRKVEKIQQER